jgi:hypothetical protein
LDFAYWFSKVLENQLKDGFKGHWMVLRGWSSVNQLASKIVSWRAYARGTVRCLQVSVFTIGKVKFQAAYENLPDLS